MYRFSFYILLIFFLGVNALESKAQERSKETIAFTVEDFKSEKEAIELTNLMVSHYGEKIVSANLEYKKKIIAVRGKTNFNPREILEFLKYQGYTAYYEEFGLIKKLSEDGKLLEVKHINED